MSCLCQRGKSTEEDPIQVSYPRNPISLHPVLQNLENPDDLEHAVPMSKIDNRMWRSQAQDLRQPAGSQIPRGGWHVAKTSNILHLKSRNNQTAARNSLRLWRHANSCQSVCSEGFPRAVTWEPVDFHLYVKLVN